MIRESSAFDVVIMKLECCIITTANAQWAKKLIDLHEFQNVSISAKMWRLLPKVPYS